MPTHQDTPRGRRSHGTARLAGFSDGVFSIAATLVVLALAVHPPGTPLQRVLHAWPGYLAYVVSFLTIGGGWLAHTALTGRLTRADPIFLQINLVLLLVVAFLPFPPRLIADALHDVEAERVAVTIYGLTLLAIRLLGSALDAYARREHLYSQHEDGEEVYERRSLLPVVIGYVTAILVGLALPKVAVALYFGIAVYLVVPFGEVRRLFVPAFINPRSTSRRPSRGRCRPGPGCRSRPAALTRLLDDRGGALAGRGAVRGGYQRPGDADPAGPRPGHPPSRCRAGVGPDRAEARELIAGSGYGGPLGEVIRLKRRGHDP